MPGGTISRGSAVRGPKNLADRRARDALFSLCGGNKREPLNKRYRTTNDSVWRKHYSYASVADCDVVDVWDSHRVLFFFKSSLLDQENEFVCQT